MSQLIQLQQLKFIPHLNCEMVLLVNCRTRPLPDLKSSFPIENQLARMCTVPSGLIAERHW